ncbi:hypothetical protein E2C01_082486 [Portunus trituberculatus]|uniref:Uncharacterized protein n=1 Tax=Portunus trituberculatus TaxID=210409 RepID=A0A5B7J105_PORTR|nr:hypothetical protein [Portunus trituberculatus]
MNTLEKLADCLCCLESSHGERTVSLNKCLCVCVCVLPYRNSALEDFDAEISRETDPLSFTEDGQTIKEELEWGDEEMDEEDQSLIKEEAAVTSPTESPTPPPKPLPPPPPLALADNKRPMVVQFKLPGGKSVPATFFSEANTELIKEKSMTSNKKD